jgi:hypothetical protein
LGARQNKIGVARRRRLRASTSRGLGMAAERRRGRKGSGWRANRGEEETMRLPNALFAGFHRLGARNELVSCMHSVSFLVFASLTSLIPMPHHIFTELAPSLIVWTLAD